MRAPRVKQFSPVAPQLVIMAWMPAAWLWRRGQGPQPARAGRRRRALEAAATAKPHCENAIRRRPWFTLPFWSQTPVERRHTWADSPSGILRLGSSPFVGCSTNAAEPHIRSPRKRLTPKFLIPEVIGLGRAGPIFITACRSQDVMRSARRGPARAIGSCGWSDALSGR